MLLLYFLIIEYIIQYMQAVIIIILRGKASFCVETQIDTASHIIHQHNTAEVFGDLSDNSRFRWDEGNAGVISCDRRG